MYICALYIEDVYHNISRGDFTRVCIIYVTGLPRPIGCLVSIGHFPQKSPVISGSVVENDVQLRGSYAS